MEMRLLRGKKKLDKLKQLKNWLNEHAHNWPGYAIVFAFVLVSGAVNIQIAMQTGGNTISSYTMALLALAAQGYLALMPIYTFARRKYLVGVLGLLVWIPCFFYSGVSAITFFDQNLADATARRSKSHETYSSKIKRLQQLRASRSLTTTVRHVSVIQSEIETILSKPGRNGQTFGQRTEDCRVNTHRAPKDCATVNVLRVELQSAQARDTLDKEIIALAGSLSSTQAVGQTRSTTVMSPLLSSIHEHTFVKIETLDDLKWILLLMICELGAAISPTIMAVSRSTAKTTTESSSALPKKGAVQYPPEVSVSSVSTTDPKLKTVCRWMAARVTVKPGAMVGSAALYKDFCEHIGGVEEAKKQGLSVQKFGRLLTEDIGLEKQKAGKGWTVHYLDIELKSIRKRQPSRLDMSAFLPKTSGVEVRVH